MSKELTKEEIIGKQFNLDLGSSSPVSVIVKDIKQDIDKVIVEYLYSTPGRTGEFTLSNFEYLACIEIIPTKTKIGKEKAKDELIKLLMNQITQLTMISKIELGDDVIGEIKRFQEIIKEDE